MTFWKRYVKTVDELNERYNSLPNKEDYIVREGKNNLSKDLITNKTKLFIVGSAIPEILLFFFTGINSYIYDWIDEALGTNLSLLVANKEIEKLRNELKEIGIVFLDVSSHICNKRKKSSDGEIVSFVPDYKTFEIVKRLKAKNPEITVVSLSKVVKQTLDKVLDVPNISKRFFEAPGRGYKHRDKIKEDEKWIEFLRTKLSK